MALELNQSSPLFLFVQYEIAAALNLTFRSYSHCLLVHSHDSTSSHDCCSMSRNPTCYRLPLGSAFREYHAIGVNIKLGKKYGLDRASTPDKSIVCLSLSLFCQSHVKTSQLVAVPDSCFTASVCFLRKLSPLLHCPTRPSGYLLSFPDRLSIVLLALGFARTAENLVVALISSPGNLKRPALLVEGSSLMTTLCLIRVSRM
ncbi:hypothetical protein QBC45DRAFT_95300 [Copromyces sp. CBS 386.78]|nr:hypothetical protein QBC45DRAFT_95300 [Copromyces sp. CBS 386.78]